LARKPGGAPGGGMPGAAAKGADGGVAARRAANCASVGWAKAPPAVVWLAAHNLVVSAELR
jgi:hypothetical protein